MGRDALLTWFASRGIQPFPFQEEVWAKVSKGKNGVLQAPTGSGKTLALFGAFLIGELEKRPQVVSAKSTVKRTIEHETLSLKIGRAHV